MGELFIAGELPTIIQTLCLAGLGDEHHSGAEKER
jgi:hypothetical protein